MRPGGLLMTPSFTASRGGRPHGGASRPEMAADATGHRAVSSGQR